MLDFRSCGVYGHVALVGAPLRGRRACAGASCLSLPVNGARDPAGLMPLGVALSDASRFTYPGGSCSRTAAAECGAMSAATDVMSSVAAPTVSA